MWLALTLPSPPGEGTAVGAAPAADRGWVSATLRRSHSEKWVLSINTTGSNNFPTEP